MRSFAGEQHLILLLTATDGHHLGHPGHGEEAAAQDGVGGGAEVDRTMVRRGQRQEEDLAHNRRDGGQHGTRGLRWQLAHGKRHLFTDDLPGRIDVHSPRKLDPDHGDAHRGRGPHPPHPEAPLSAASMGNVTWLSTSVGAMPWASVMTVTVGAVRSGNTSTGMRRAV